MKPEHSNKASNYPPAILWHDNADHLLFDLGYSYGLLQRAEELLGEALEARDFSLIQVAELFNDLANFRLSRLNQREAIKRAAAQAAERAQNLIPVTPPL